MSETKINPWFSSGINKSVNTEFASYYPSYNNYLYISHLDEGFKYWNLPASPDVITDSMGSTWQASEALGRTAPIFTYSKSGPRSVNISFKLHRDIFMMDNIQNASTFVGDSSTLNDPWEDYVDKLINALRAIALPMYDFNTKTITPPMVALRLGNELFIKGVVDGEIGLNFEKPILSNDRYAVVSISLSIKEIDPYDARQVFEQGGFRGVTSCMKRGMNLE